MRIVDLPASERPRERLRALGATALSDRELIAVVLGTGGAPGVGAHTLAERLLARFGSLRALSQAHPAELAAVTGVGPAKAAAMTAAFELARRGERGEAATRVTSAADLASVAAPLLHGRTRERLVVVVCDRGNRVLGCDVLSEGSADRSLLPVREVMVAVLRRDGSAFGLAHNHPSGNPTPSDDDVAATLQIAQAATSAGLRFLDHVVVTDSDWQRVTTTRRGCDPSLADPGAPVPRTVAARQTIAARRGRVAQRALANRLHRGQ